MKETVKTLAKVNGQSIVIIENGDKRVPITPICDALGISPQGQFEKIKSHPVLSSTHKMILWVAADGKEREMLTIPYKYIFGWLFSIDIRKVKPEASESVFKYQMECYDVLYEHFVLREKFEREKNEALVALYAQLNNIKTDFKDARSRLTQKQNEIQQVIGLDFDTWRQTATQLTFPWTETQNAEEV